MPDPPPIPDAQAAEIRCVYCNYTGAVRTYFKFETTPMASYSLSGTMPKVAVREWPYAECKVEFGGCGHVSRGRFE